MAPTNYKYIYGPVASRRLGLSLGVDIVPFKHCSFNCIYCQVGKTTHLDLTRQALVPIENVLKEITDNTSRNESIDYITFSGSGEPTLHSELGILIQRLRSKTSIPVAVLTNSSLIDRADVQRDLSHASVVAPTLCSTRDDTYMRIHRAHKSIKVSTIIEGLISFRKSYSGAIWLEIMMINGLNDTEEEIRSMKEVISRIQPDKVHLNTVVRPPLESSVSSVSPEMLERARNIIGDRAEIIVTQQKNPARLAHRNAVSRILDIIQRRPSTIEDIAAVSGIEPVELSGQLTRLIEQGKVRKHRHQDNVFYEIAPREEA